VNLNAKLKQLRKRQQTSRPATDQALKTCYQKQAGFHNLSLNTIKRMEQPEGEQSRVYQRGWFSKLWEAFKSKRTPPKNEPENKPENEKKTVGVPDEFY